MCAVGGFLRLWGWAALSWVVAATLPAAAAAQDVTPSTDMDLQLFFPPAGPGATFTIDRPEVPRHLSFVVGLAASYSDGLLVREGDGQTVVDSRTQVELLAALGLFEWMELGLAIPLNIVSVADDPFAPTTSTSTEVGAGDVRLSLKVPLLRGDLAASARLVVTLPTGDGAALAGTDYWTFAPSAVGAYRMGAFELSAELGYRLRRQAILGDLEYDDELFVQAGASYAIIESLRVIAELQSRIGVGGNTTRSNEHPVDMNAGVRWSAAPGLTVDVGGGTGLASGYGSPTFRVFSIVRYATEREPCAAGPEDFDGYLDGDFCADPDNDADGIEDEFDDCPNDAEDVDEFLDADGCPDTDNDADGVQDATDNCPIESEDLDGYQDEDGCPEPDNDEDGIPDGLDECPMEPEDRDSYQDEDGCPEPGPNAATVTVTDTRILISERIYFDFDTDTIRSVSLPLLDQVATVVQEIPNRDIRVEGYTDADGNDQYNLDLSYRRARAVVEYLAGRGVPRSRLSYVGYGEANPVAPNDSAEGQALNRRVEFTIMEPGEATTQPRRRRRSRDRDASD